jgi:tRNA U34 5-carboxymethylaminomethyl modifying GTPase MnmE/TrmE
VERAGIARALAVQGDVDLLVRATEAGQPAAVPPAVGAGSEGDADGGRRPEVIEVTTKADIVADHATLPGSAPVPGRDGVVTSVVTGLGIDRLADRIVAMLVPEDVADPDLLAGAVPFTAAQVTLVERLRAAREFSPRERPQRTGRGGES